MVSKIGYYFTILCAFSINAYPNNYNKLLDASTLVTVNVFCRHGARTPLADLPPRAQFQPTNWNVEPGVLTKVGEQKMFELGKKLRERYNAFLNPKYISSELYALSTPVQRTQNSINALLTGLYSVNGNARVPYIKIHTDEGFIDQSTIINSNRCPAFKAEQQIAQTRARYDDKGFENVYRYLTQYSGKQISNMYDIFAIWDNLECLAHNQLRIPQWASAVYPEAMGQISAKVLRSMITGTNKMVQLAAGPYIKELHHLFTAASYGDPNMYKIYIHLGHDFSMTANLAGLGIYEKIVNPGDAMVTELHYLPGTGYFVQILYISEGGSSVAQIPIKDCGYPCPLKGFLELTKDVIPRNWEQECKIF